MNRIEKLLMLIVVLTIVTIFVNYLTNFFLARIYGPETLGQMSLFVKNISMLIIFFKFLVNICVAFWLYNVAKQYHQNPSGWFCFALFLGVIALVVFYIIRIHDMFEKQCSQSEIR
jgi:hypothetical protein